MSILTGKKVLMVEQNKGTFSKLTSELGKHRSVITCILSPELSNAVLDELKPDIIVVDNLIRAPKLEAFLKYLHGSPLRNRFPVLVLVEENQKQIGQTLLELSTDYFTSTEAPDSVVIKMKSIFGEPDTASGVKTIDIHTIPPNTKSVGTRVFIVEDDMLLRTLVESKLESVGFLYGNATDGADAISKIRSFRPQVIILDLMLPNKDGFQILKELKSDLELKSIPVIVFSNRDSQEDKQTVFSLGADRFYVKALTDLSFLVESIEELAVK